MRIVIATTQVPFVRGGAELQAEGLRDALRRAGHEAELVAIPFKWYPPEVILDHMLACRLLDLTEAACCNVDLLIGLKFPAYLISHPNKVLWVIHQHRTAYELWDHPIADLIHSPNGLQVRDAIQQADVNTFREARAIYAESETVAKRMKRYCGVASTPLYHPPPSAEKFYTRAAEDYLFFPSRLVMAKRQALVLEALSLTKEPIVVRFSGAADEPSYEITLKKAARKLKIEDRVQWLGPITEGEKYEQYARSLGVIFPPVDEDYGYITLEAMLSAKPVITCADSGGSLEFITDEENGLVTQPTAESLAAAMDRLWRDRAHAKQLGEASRARYDQMGLNWTRVIRTLLS
jgi:glycosyltransferase involved in cell wall biosynthesis